MRFYSNFFFAHCESPLEALGLWPYNLYKRRAKALRNIQIARYIHGRIGDNCATLFSELMCVLPCEIMVELGIGLII